MKMINKNRKGFTLVEMMLSLAIIMLIGGVVVSLVVSISNSFTTTYNIDDSADYAMLYAKGFENSFLANSQKPFASGSECYWEVKPNAGVPTLRVKTPENSDEVSVFDPQFLGSSSNPKWNIMMFYKWDAATECVYYRVLLKDNLNATDYTYMYEGSFWVPRYNDRKTNSGAASRSIYVDEESEAMTDTVLDDHGFDSSRFSSEQLDGTYYAKIYYKA